MRASIRRLHLFTALGIAAVTSCYTAFRYVNGAVPGSDFFRLYNFIVLILIVTWLADDPALPSAERPTFDHGLMLWTLFPLFPMYQQFVARRWRGVATVLGVAMLLFAPNLTIVVLSLVA